VSDPSETPAAEAWPALPVGTELTIVKLAPDGERVTTYPAWVIEAGAPEPWIAARADWVRKVVELDGLRFIPGDRLHEFFSPAHPFNLFSVWSPEGALRGWYANVTYPTRLDVSTSPATLYWHDLYVDVIGLPDGVVVVRDEDELDEARVAESDPALYALITAARDELLRRLAARHFPFHER
jgi:hypothetical protein